MRASSPVRLTPWSPTIHTAPLCDLLLARVMPHGTESWDNAIFARKDGTLTPLVQVQYLPAQ